MQKLRTLAAFFLVEKQQPQRERKKEEENNAKYYGHFRRWRTHSARTNLIAEDHAKAPGVTLSDQYLHCDHPRKLPHYQDCAKCLGDCSVLHWSQ